MPDSLIDSEEVQGSESEGSTSSNSEWGGWIRIVATQVMKMIIQTGRMCNPCDTFI